jgi:CubicO group peptidase (beta-lactamase class C family)
MKSFVILLLCVLLLPVGVVAQKGSVVVANQKTTAHQRTPTAVSKSNAQKLDKSLDGLPQYVEELMKRLPVVPGLAIAVVRGDKVIFAQGFGYRNVKSKLPVTP